MSLKNLEGVSKFKIEELPKGLRIVELPQVSTEEKLFEIGAKRDIYGRMVYKNSGLGMEVYWVKLLDDNFEDRGWYAFSHHIIKESTMH